MEKKGYMISDAVNIVHVEAHVLRYWEDELGLTVPRNELGHRFYTKENIRQFQRIKELKEQGYQLKAIRTILHNGEHGIEMEQPKTTFLINPKRYTKTHNPTVEEIGEERGKIHSSISVPSKTNEISNPCIEDRQRKKMEERMRAPVASESLMEDQMRTPMASESLMESRMRTPMGSESLMEDRMRITKESSIGVAKNAEERMEEFRELMNHIVGRAVERNNEELTLMIGREVAEQVIKELDFLAREADESAQERYRNLESAIRQRQKTEKKSYLTKKSERAAIKKAIKEERREERQRKRFEKRLKKNDR